MITLNINDSLVDVDVDPAMPLLWVLRDVLGLTGTKYGCGAALCGACTVQLNGQATRSCVLPVSAVTGRRITTIEGLAGPVALAVQDAWIQGNVVQCGYCQGGQVLAAVTLLATNPRPTDDDIDSAMSGNVCRCATYYRIRAAIHAAANTLPETPA